ncbi:hypothetical protein J6590_029002 [Homalodisca vitripennis]|nr:hypothetical protein J6590_029002 [Homalodisca vitripennis]
MFPDRVVLHDQSVLGRDSHPVLGDEEARDGADAAGESAVPEHQHARLIHQQFRAHFVLRRDSQTSCSPLEEGEEKTDQEVSAVEISKTTEERTQVGAEQQQWRPQPNFSWQLSGPSPLQNHRGSVNL